MTYSLKFTNPMGDSTLGNPLFHWESAVFVNFTQGIFNRNLLTRNWEDRREAIVRTMSNLQNASGGLSLDTQPAFERRRIFRLLLWPLDKITAMLDSEARFLPQEQFRDNEAEALYNTIVRVNLLKMVCPPHRDGNGYRRSLQDATDALLSELWFQHEMTYEHRKVNSDWWMARLVDDQMGDTGQLVLLPDKNGPQTDSFLENLNTDTRSEVSWSDGYIRDLRALGLWKKDPLMNATNAAVEHELLKDFKLFSEAQDNLLEVDDIPPVEEITAATVKEIEEGMLKERKVSAGREGLASTAQKKSRKPRQ